MKLVFIASWLKKVNIKESEKKTDWFNIRRMCPSGATYLPATVVYFILLLGLFWVRVHELRRMDRFNIIKIF